MNNLIVLQGLPASGKSTWAEKYVKTHPDTYRVNRDALRLMLYAEQFNSDREYPVTVAESSIIEALLWSSCDVIVDACHLSDKSLLSMVHLADDVDAYTKLMVFPAPAVLCIRRDEKRGEKMVGSDVIHRMNESRKKLDKDVLAMFDEVETMPL